MKYHLDGVIGMKGVLVNAKLPVEPKPTIAFPRTKAFYKMLSLHDNV